MSSPQQSGVYKITLYERNNLSLTYTDEDTISNISTGGQTVELTYCEKVNYNFMMIAGKNSNNKYNYFIDFLYESLTEATKADIATIKDSIYGWAVFLEYSNGEDWLFDCLFKLNETELEGNVDHGWKLQLYNKLPCIKRPLKYE